MGKRRRRQWLLGLAVLLLAAVLVPLGRANPRAGGVALLVLAAGLSYLSGLHFVTKGRVLRGEAAPLPGKGRAVRGRARPPRSGWGRSALYVTPVGAAALFALSLLVYPHSGRGWSVFLVAVPFGLVAGLHHWWPAISGHVANDLAARWGSAIMLLGALTLVLPQLRLGSLGVPEHHAAHALEEQALLFMSGVGACTFLIGLVVSLWSLTARAQRDPQLTDRNVAHAQ